MNFKNLQLLLVFLGFGIMQTNAQYKTSFKVDDKSIKVVWFQAKQVSLINIKTHKASFFELSSAGEGSYKSELYFEHEVKNDSLIIKSVFPKHLLFGDNKMTSMQEFSVKVNFELPENLKLIIDSDIASIEGNGNFNYLQIETKAGHIFLNPIYGDTRLNSFSGSIKIKTDQAKIEAKSQSGTLSIQQSFYEKYNHILRTVKGDIKVIQME